MDRQQPTRPLEEAPRACGERAPRRGFEPRTLRLTAACSTVELSGNDREGTPPQTKTIPDACRNVKRSKEVLVRSRSRGEVSWANPMYTSARKYQSPLSPDNPSTGGCVMGGGP